MISRPMLISCTCLLSKTRNKVLICDSCIIVMFAASNDTDELSDTFFFGGGEGALWPGGRALDSELTDLHVLSLSKAH